MHQQSTLQTQKLNPHIVILHSWKIPAALTGLIGTLGGVVISYLTLKHSLERDKHKVKVKLGMSHMIILPGKDSSKTQVTVSVANHGSLPFTVVNVGICIGRRSGTLLMPHPVGTHTTPVTLERDGTCNFWTDHDEAIDGMKNMTKRSHIKVRAYISDYAGHRFVSEWTDVRFRDTWISKIGDMIEKRWKAVLTAIRP